MYRPGVLSPKRPFKWPLMSQGLGGGVDGGRRQGVGVGGRSFGFVDSLSHHPSFPLLFVL